MRRFEAIVIARDDLRRASHGLRPARLYNLTAHPSSREMIDCRVKLGSSVRRTCACAKDALTFPAWAAIFMELLWLLLFLLGVGYLIAPIIGVVMAIATRDRVRRLEFRVAELQRGLAAATAGAAAPPPPPRPEPPADEPIPTSPVVEPFGRRVGPSRSWPRRRSQSRPWPQRREERRRPSNRRRRHHPRHRSRRARRHHPTRCRPRGNVRHPAGSSGSAACRARARRHLPGQIRSRQGLIGPGVRVLLGGLLAIALVAAGEWTRRKESLDGIAGLPSAAHPQHPHRRGNGCGLCHGLRGLWALRFPIPCPRFRSARHRRLATLAAALLHGPALAGLGLVGAYVTPLLVSAMPNYWALYIYLAVVTAAAFALAAPGCGVGSRITAMVFGFLWIFPGVVTTRDRRLHSHFIPAADSRSHAFHAFAGFVLVAAFIVCGCCLDRTRIRPDRRRIVGRARRLSRRHRVLVLASRHDGSRSRFCT